MIELLREERLRDFSFAEFLKAYRRKEKIHISREKSRETTSFRCIISYIYNQLTTLQKSLRCFFFLYKQENSPTKIVIHYVAIRTIYIMTRLRVLVVNVRTALSDTYICI